MANFGIGTLALGRIPLRLGFALQPVHTEPCAHWHQIKGYSAHSLVPALRRDRFKLGAWDGPGVRPGQGAVGHPPYVSNCFSAYGIMPRERRYDSVDILRRNFPALMRRSLSIFTR
jgi:hypothetical protein